MNKNFDKNRKKIKACNKLIINYLVKQDIPIVFIAFFLRKNDVFNDINEITSKYNKLSEEDKEILKNIVSNISENALSEDERENFFKERYYSLSLKRVPPTYKAEMAYDCYLDLEKDGEDISYSFIQFYVNECNLFERPDGKIVYKKYSVLKELYEDFQKKEDREKKVSFMIFIECLNYLFGENLPRSISVEQIVNAKEQMEKEKG